MHSLRNHGWHIENFKLNTKYFYIILTIIQIRFEKDKNDLQDPQLIRILISIAWFTQSESHGKLHLLIYHSQKYIYIIYKNEITCGWNLCSFSPNTWYTTGCIHHKTRNSKMFPVWLRIAVDQYLPTSEISPDSNISVIELSLNTSGLNFYYKYYFVHELKGRWINFLHLYLDWFLNLSTIKNS